MEQEKLIKQFKFEREMKVLVRDGIQPKKYEQKYKNSTKFRKYTTIAHEKLAGYSDILADDEELDLMELFIIDSESAKYRIWKLLIVILQVASSYMYCMLAAYRDYTWENIWIPMECVFGFDMLINCISDYRNKMEFKVRDIYEIAPRYIKGPFFMDFLPLLPLQSMSLKNNM